MKSRIIVSGEIATGEAVDVLVEAIREDKVPVPAAFEFAWEQEIVDQLLDAAGGPLVIEGDYRGDRTFAHTRQACQRIGVAFVYEVPTPEGTSSTVFDPHEMTFHSTFNYEGKADAPVMTINQMADFAGMTDDEIGASMRRMMRKLERGAEVARAPFAVSAEARMRYQTTTGTPSM